MDNIEFVANTGAAVVDIEFVVNTGAAVALIRKDVTCKKRQCTCS